MRVGTFLRRWYEGGGVSRHTLELVRRIDEVEWVCFGHEFDVDVPNPVEIPKVPGSRSVKDVGNLLRSPRMIRRWREAHDLDLVHGQDVNLLCTDLVTVHSCFPAYAREQLSRLYTLAHPMYHKNRLSQKLVLERIDGPIAAVSEDLRQDLLGFYDLDPDQVHVVHNGVDVERFHPDRDGAAVRERHGIDPETPLLLFVGHEHERKGMAEILDALTQLPSEVELLAVGGGHHEPWQERARERGVADRITWTGRVPDDELPDHYAAGDVFVFPTRYESFGLVVLEAMATGTPVVTTDLACIQEFCTHGEHGALVPPRDAEATAQAIETCLGPEGDRMAKQARQQAEAFSWDRTARQTLELYRSALA